MKISKIQFECLACKGSVEAFFRYVLSTCFANGLMSRKEVAKEPSKPHAIEEQQHKQQEEDPSLFALCASALSLTSFRAIALGTLGSYIS